MSMQELYSNEQYCKDELLRIRESFGNKNTFNSKTIDASRYSLSYMLLYCPEEMYYMVLSTFNELA
jgi:hypothetical protein